MPLTADEAALADLTTSSRGLSSNDSEFGPASRLVSVFLCGAFAFLELYCTQPLLPLLSRVFHASEASVGLTVSASTLGVAISAALLALFAERFDRKRIIIRAMAMLGVVVALTATAPNLQALAWWRLAQGLLTPAIFTITIAYVTEEWPAKSVPRVMSIYVAGTVFGGFVGRVAGGMLTEHFGWRAMFAILGIVGTSGALLTNRLLRPSKFRSISGRAEMLWSPVLRNLQDRRLLATLGIGFCMLFALVAMFSYVTFYLAAAPFHLSTAALSWLFTVYLVGLGATLAAGTVLARIGLRHGMLAAIGVCLLGVITTLLPSLFAVAVGLSLTSAGVFIAQTSANSFLRDAAPAGARVSAAGMYICSYYVGGTVGGVLPGIFWKLAGWQGCTAVICLFLALAAILTYFGWRPISREADPISL